LILLTVNTSCQSTQADTLINIEYTAETRGSSLKVFIQQGTLTYDDAEMRLTGEDWTALVALVDSIDLNGLKDLKAPSEDRYRDAALFAALKVTTSDGTFTSAQFDHGNPPEAIAPLVTKILSLAGLN
jgi:hypothetical protein